MQFVFAVIGVPLISAFVQKLACNTPAIFLKYFLLVQARAEHQDQFTFCDS